jgi:hypothetical protein
VIRNEERHVHDLPADPRSMSAREALARAILRSEHWGPRTDGSDAEDDRDIIESFIEQADEVVVELRRLGFQVLPAIPEPVGR